MRRLLCLIVVSGVCLAVCGDAAGNRFKPRSNRVRRPNSREGQRQSLVIGGNLAHKDAAPWHVAIMYKHKLHCSGSLLRNDVVLTSAECIKDLEPADMLVRAGSKFFKNGGQVRKVRETVHHPDYNARAGVFNVGLLQLIRPLNDTVSETTNIRPIALADEQDVLPAAVTVYGWGISDKMTNNTITKRLRQVQAKVYSTKKCARFLEDESLAENVFCAGDRPKKVNVCNDDPGSPAIGGDDLLYGVVSEVGACSTDTHTTVFTNVIGVRSWIVETYGEFKTNTQKRRRLFGRN